MNNEAAEEFFFGLPDENINSTILQLTKLEELEKLIEKRGESWAFEIGFRYWELLQSPYIKERDKELGELERRFSNSNNSTIRCAIIIRFLLSLYQLNLKEIEAIQHKFLTYDSDFRLMFAIRYADLLRDFLSGKFSVDDLKERYEKCPKGLRHIFIKEVATTASKK